MGNKKLLLGILAVFLTIPVVGQSGATLKLSIQNASTKEGLLMVSVQLTGPSGNNTYHYTDDDGVLTVSGLDYGKYKLSARTMGFADLEQTFTIDKAEFDLGVLAMQPTSTVLKEYTVHGTAMRTSQKGDTVSYNAAAFKVAADATTETLLSKMPGIIIGPDGSVTAQGETVEKVLVDGKEFFGNDVSSAIKNLPAEVVDRIEVFNKLSDQAEFSGFDDGEGYKAINIVTQSAKRTGQFGKVYGAYGITDKYLAGGNINIFHGTSRLSIIGLANNVNQQNFSFEDIAGVTSSSGRSSSGGIMMGGGSGGRGNDMRTFMVRPEDGILTVQSIGLNFSDTWGKNKKLNFTGSYFFNHTRNANDQYRENWDITRSDEIWYTESSSSTHSHNYNHRFNAKIDYKINEANSLMFRPWFSYQKYTSTGESVAEQESHFADGTVIPIQSWSTYSSNEREAYNTGLFAMYRSRLGKAGRTLTVTASGNYSKNDNLSETNQSFFFPPYSTGNEPVADSLFKRRAINDTYSYRLNGGLTYTEPIGEKSQLSVEYNARYNYSDADRRTHLWDELNERYDPYYDPSLSSIYNSGYMTQSVGPGYRLATDKVNISVSTLYQNATLNNEQTMPVVFDDKHSFNNFLYRANMRFNFNPANSINVRLASYTRTPSASQLMEIPDISSPENVTIGNSALKPTYNNRAHVFYINSNVTKGTTLTLAVSGTVSGNYIANSTTTGADVVIPNSGGLTLGQGNRLVEYVNLSGYWNTNIFASYGFPLKPLYSNFNFDLYAQFGDTPSVMNGVKRKMRETYYGGGATLGSNISENIDFTLRYRGSYNVTNTKYSGFSAINRFFEHYASTSVKWVMWKGITFTGDAIYNFYKGITNDYKEEYILVNLYVGKKVFRNQMGEISIGINDLLDQNVAFRRSVSDQSITNTTNAAIGRYFAVKFVYNIRNFGKGRTAADFGGDAAYPGAGADIQRVPPGGMGHGGIMPHRN